MKLLLSHIALFLIPGLELMSTQISSDKYVLEDSKVQAESNEEIYKTLEIRYKNFGSSNSREIDVDGKKFKCFRDKKSAIKYYYLVKKDSPELVVYYVFSGIPKASEIYTFKVME